MDRSITAYVDSELETLRKEIKNVEEHLQQLTTEKAEIEKIIYEFGVRYNRELGELIIKILKWRKDNSVGTLFQNEAETDYNSFFKNYQISKREKSFTLTEFEKQEIKSKYRKASKFCHPDIVADNQKEKAHKIFTELNEAYEMNDLGKVKVILESLEHGGLFVSKVDTTTEKIILQLQLKKIRLLVSELESEIKKMITGETYLKIINIENLNEYFEKTKQELQQQINHLKHGRQ